MPDIKRKKEQRKRKRLREWVKKENVEEVEIRLLRVKKT